MHSSSSTDSPSEEFTSRERLLAGSSEIIAVSSILDALFDDTEPEPRTDARNAQFSFVQQPDRKIGRRIYFLGSVRGGRSLFIGVGVSRLLPYRHYLTTSGTRWIWRPGTLVSCDRSMCSGARLMEKEQGMSRKVRQRSEVATVRIDDDNSCGPAKFGECRLSMRRKSDGTVVWCTAGGPTHQIRQRWRIRNVPPHALMLAEQ